MRNFWKNIIPFGLVLLCLLTLTAPAFAAQAADDELLIYAEPVENEEGRKAFRLEFHNGYSDKAAINTGKGGAVFRLETTEGNISYQTGQALAQRLKDAGLDELYMNGIAGKCDLSAQIDFGAVPGETRALVLGNIHLGNAGFAGPACPDVIIYDAEKGIIGARVDFAAESYSPIYEDGTEAPADTEETRNIVWNEPEAGIIVPETQNSETELESTEKEEPEEESRPSQTKQAEKKESSGNPQQEPSGTVTILIICVIVLAAALLGVLAFLIVHMSRQKKQKKVEDRDDRMPPPFM